MTNEFIQIQGTKPTAPHVEGKPFFIASEAYEKIKYSFNHPLRIPRVSVTLKILRALGLLPDGAFIQGRDATREELLGFHTPEYLDALAEADREQHVPLGAREKHNLGTFENPVFPGVFRGPKLATGSSVQGAEAVIAGNTAFSPAGGMHHALPDRAHGFCYINDPVIGIRRFLQEGWRVLYVDLDAHHPNGVQEAFYDSDQVVVFSIHMDPSYAFPYTGKMDEIGSGPGEGFTVNLPLEKRVNDYEFLFCLDTLIPEIVRRFRPDVVVAQCGADALLEDYLSKFALSNLGLNRAVQLVRENSPRFLAIGGGGYHPYAVVRAWTHIWAGIAGLEVPKEFNREAQEILSRIDYEELDDIDRSHMKVQIYDPPRGAGIRQETRDRVDWLKKNVLPKIEPRSTGLDGLVPHPPL